MSTEFKDWINAFAERLLSPVTGTFLVSWSFINWEITLSLIFGSERIHRIEMIKALLRESTWCSLLWFPLIFTILYLFLIPLTKEFYASFIGTIEYRNSLRKNSIHQNLMETEQYRQTLKAINSSLHRGLAETKSNLDQLERLLASPKYSSMEKLSQAETLTKQYLTHCSVFLDTHRDFQDHYVESIPQLTKVFLSLYSNQDARKPSAMKSRLRNIFRR